MANILIIDGQGGRLGSELVTAIKGTVPKENITCVGTNSIATQAMLKAGCGQAATGENAVIVNARNADIIIGPVGIVIADSLLGEITPGMAEALGKSSAVKLLLPVNKCNNIIVGTRGLSTSEIIDEAVSRVKAIVNG